MLTLFVAVIGGVVVAAAAAAFVAGVGTAVVVEVGAIGMVADVVGVEWCYLLLLLPMLQKVVMRLLSSLPYYCSSCCFLLLWTSYQTTYRVGGNGISKPTFAILLTKASTQSETQDRSTDKRMTAGDATWERRNRRLATAQTNAWNHNTSIFQSPINTWNHNT